MTTIFVSYASDDGDFIEAVIAHAEARTRSARSSLTFFRAHDPDSIRAGDKWRERILSAMNRARVAVFFISNNSISRPWLNFELGYMEKSGAAAVICVTIDYVEKIDGPVAVHQLAALPREPKLAAERLLALVGERIPIGPEKTSKNTIQIASNIYPLQRGWQRYGRGANTREEVARTPYGVSFGKSSDEGGFRYPASSDSLEAPWEFLFFRASTTVGVNVYFVMEMSDGSYVKLHASTDFDSVTYASHQRDEFQIAVPQQDRPERLIVNTRSYVPRLGQEPVAVRGLRVRAPTELADIGMFDARNSIPQKLRRGSLELTLP